MGLLRGLVMAPVAGPLNGAIWIVGKIHEAALAEHNDPAVIRRALTELETALLKDEITEDEYDQGEEILLQRLSAAR